MSEKDAEVKHRKSREYVVRGSIVFLIGLLMTVLLALSIAGYIPPIPEEPQDPYYIPPFIFGISSIFVVVLGLCMMAYGYILRNVMRARFSACMLSPSSHN
jgi:O-antigen/teichoic acid export membrane protein